MPFKKHQNTPFHKSTLLSIMKKYTLLGLILFNSFLFSQEVHPVPTQQETAEPKQETIAFIRQFLANNYRIPPAIYDSIGSIQLMADFVLTKEGQVKDPKIIYSSRPCLLCEKEYLRVLRMLPMINPMKEEELPVDYRFRIPLHLVIPE